MPSRSQTDTEMAALEVIDIRSFSSLWFWIVLALTWFSASHWVIGIPYDLIQRARRNGGQDARDLEVLMKINARRFFNLSTTPGLWVLGGCCAGLSSLALLGFTYQIELAQALFLLSFPLALITLVSLRTVRVVLSENQLSEVLYQRLWKHRVTTQIIGLAAIFVTATWGMYHNLAHMVLGG